MLRFEKIYFRRYNTRENFDTLGHRGESPQDSDLKEYNTARRGPMKFDITCMVKV